MSDAPSRGPLPVLRTERLLLRPFRPDDGPAVERIAGAFEIADTTLTIPHPYPVGGGAHWISSLATAWEDGTRLTLAVTPGDAPDELVAAVGISIDARYAYGELGYWVAVERWGQGIAAEAARALVDFAFKRLGLHRIQARHLVRNAPSGRVMQKLGMRFEGVLRGALRKWDRFEDVAMYGLLASDRLHPPVAAEAAPARDASGSVALAQLRRLREHTTWGDAVLLAALEACGPALPAEALREYAHVVGAGEVWLARIEGRAPRLAVWPTLGLEEAASSAVSIREGYDRLLSALEEADLSREVRYTNSAGRSFATPIGDILLHVALHGQYHRGKINLMLRQAHGEPAPVDYIAFARGAPAATNDAVRTSDRS